MTQSEREAYERAGQESMVVILVDGRPVLDTLARLTKNKESSL